MNKGNKSNATNISDCVLKKLKDLKKNAADGISSVENNFTRFYSQNMESLDKEIKTAIKQIEYPELENINIPLQLWKSLIREIDNIDGIDDSDSRELIYTNLILDISQKNSLQVDELIQALVVLREFYNKNIFTDPAV